MQPDERLLSAVERLLGHLSTVVAAHGDLHQPSPDGPGSPGSVAFSKHPPPEAFLVAVDPACRKADCGPGAVDVAVPAATYPRPMAAGCLAMRIIPGQLPPAPSVPVTHPSMVTPGEDHVQVSIDPGLTAGAYLGRLVDQTGTVQRPFAIYLSGLT